MCLLAILLFHMRTEGREQGQNVKAQYLIANTSKLDTYSVLSDSGRSYAFDHKAGGFGRGEGVRCLVLKPLNAAMASGDSVRAVVAGCGVNQDGRTKGIKMPSRAAQESLIRSLYKSARLDPSKTEYVEAHPGVNIAPLVLEDIEIAPLSPTPAPLLGSGEMLELGLF